MPRLNIYVPSDVYELTQKWRDSVNLSEICTRAIQDELAAADEDRAPYVLHEKLRSPSPLEGALTERFRLAEALVAERMRPEQSLRDALGELAAGYLDRNVSDGAQIAIAGGRQMWCMVRQASPRRIKATVTALGAQQADPKLLHAHPNTLATLLWLLYSPRTEAHVIGAGAAPVAWSSRMPRKKQPTYFVFASCSTFDPQSPFARLIGKKATAELVQRHIVGDYAYVFLDAKGSAVPATLAPPAFTLPAPVLEALSRRDDARTVVVAGGPEKLDVLRKVLRAQLCNVLITDAGTAQQLLRRPGGPQP